MTYDQWKTTDPREYEPQQEDEATELELTYDALRQAQAEIKDLNEYIDRLRKELEKFNIKF